MAQEPRSVPRQIIGFSLSPEMASEVKVEAARRGIPLKKLFEELWTDYLKKQKHKDDAR